MIEERHIETFTIDWQGIALLVTYEADWLNMGAHGRFATAHLQVQSVSPPRAPLPITETGYRSLFTDRERIEHHGGPVEYVRLWIEDAAKSPAWQCHVSDTKQLSLF